MSRLMPGENEKIDNINRLVAMVLGDNPTESEEGLRSLLSIFKPMILKICNKWSIYFNDSDHHLIPWSDLIVDAEFWFYHYTKFKYIEDGKATYNKFIKDHMDQRIRYIYESELSYNKKHIFPDPDKRDENDGDPLEFVIHHYKGEHQPDIDEDIIEDEHRNAVVNLTTRILLRIDDRRYFNEREAQLFRRCILNSETHEDVGRILGISRTRVSQLVGKIREKLREQMLNEPEWWKVY